MSEMRLNERAYGVRPDYGAVYGNLGPGIKQLSSIKSESPGKPGLSEESDGPDQFGQELNSASQSSSLTTGSSLPVP